MDGRLRRQGELDTPLALLSPMTAFKPNDRGEAPTPASFSIDSQPAQTVLRSASGRRAAEFPNYVWLIGTGMAGLAATELDYRLVLEAPSALPAQTAGVVALATIATATLGRFLFETWRWLTPGGTITIDDRK